MLQAGKNTITFRAYWGYTMFDYLEIAPASESLTNLQPTRQLSNPNASDSTKRLYQYLCDQYGKHIISGQQEYCGSHNYNLYADPTNFIKDNEAEFEYLEKTTGHTITFDAGEDGYFMSYGSADVKKHQTFTKKLDNGTYNIADYTCWANTRPNRDSSDLSSDYTIDYWTDEDGNRLENDQFTVDKQNKTLTAHWICNMQIRLDSEQLEPIGQIGSYTYSGMNTSNMLLAEGTHKFSELNQPVQTYFPEKYLFEVVGWKDSRDKTDIIHGLEEEFVLSDEEQDTVFTAVWKQKGVAVILHADKNFQNATGNAVAPEHDFNESLCS